MKISDHNINQAEQLFYESLESQKVGNFISAKENLIKALKLYPGRESIINNLAITYFNLEDPLSLEGLINDQKINNIDQKNLIKIYILYLKKNYNESIDLCLRNTNIKSGNYEQIIDILIKCYFKIKDHKNTFKFMRISLRSKNFLDQKYYHPRVEYSTELFNSQRINVFVLCSTHTIQKR